MAVRLALARKQVMMKYLSAVVFFLVVLGTASAQRTADDLEGLTREELITLVRQLRAENEAMRQRLSSERNETSPTEDHPDWVDRRVLRAVIRAMHAEIGRLRQDVDDLDERIAKGKRGRIDKRLNREWRRDPRTGDLVFRDRSAKARMLRTWKVQARDAEERLRDAQQGTPDPVVGLTIPLSVGQIGRLPAMSFVEQVLDARSALLDCVFDYLPPGSNTIEPKREPLLLRGVDMTNVVDDQKVLVRSTVIISGTYRYTTVLGASRTVLVAEPIELQKYVEYIRANGLFP